MTFDKPNTIDSVRVVFGNDVLGGVFAFKDGGVMVALRGYFDDSGSHDGSPVFVWAGWVGSAERWDKVERLWAETLSARGLNAFHMTECVTDTQGPYGSRGDRDLLIHDLRKILIDHKMTGIGAGIVAKAWERAPPWFSGPVPDPNRAAAAICVSLVNEVLQKYRDRMTAPVALFFDGGAKGDDIISIMVESFNEVSGGADALSFLPVGKSPALQAADMIAWELRNDMLNYERDGSGRAFRPHFAHFVDADCMVFSVMNDEAVDAMYRRGPPPTWNKPF